jgi:hypothetical protein
MFYKHTHATHMGKKLENSQAFKYIRMYMYTQMVLFDYFHKFRKRPGQVGGEGSGIEKVKRVRAKFTKSFSLNRLGRSSMHLHLL